MRTYVILFSVVASCGGVACSRTPRPAADLIVTRASVWTGDSGRPEAQAIAIVGDRIAGVGSVEEIDAWRGPATRIVDAGGRRVVPGFDDAHVHFVDGGRQLDNVDLKDADSPEEFARRIGARFRTLLDNGVRLALGTDWYVAPLNPMLTLYAATTRATLDGRNPNGWVPEQKISIAEAVSAYTAGSAFAEFQEADKGSLARGKLADLVMLSEDIFKISPAAIKDVRVVTTIAGGRIVYQQR